MKINKLSLITALCFIVVGCGGGSESISVEPVSATLPEDAQWQSNFTFSDTPVVTSNAANGSVAVSTSGISYTPNANFNGSDSLTVEAGNTRYVVSLTITPVNDLPILSNAQLNVSAGDEVTGQLLATDVDGDAVTFSIKEVPSNGILDLQDSGHFTYTPNDFGLPIDSFVVNLNDGTATVESDVELSPSYSSNAEKAAYYYRSDFSHLKQSQDILSGVNDDIATQDAYVSLAIGYANAGLTEQLTQILENNLTTQQAKATAFRRLGNFESDRGNSEAAASFYQQSVQTYAQFIADNGVENITSNDALFIQSLFADARVLDNAELTSIVEEQLSLYLTELGGINVEYTTAFGRFITAYRFEVQDAVTKYQLNRTDENLSAALNSANRFTNIVRQTGYQLVRRGENEGERNFRLAPLYNAEAVSYFFALGELELAKEQLAYTLSYYGGVSYDDDFARDALPYAEITKAEYAFPLIDAAYFMEVLYPDFESNYASTLVTPDNIFADDVNNAVLDAMAVNAVLVDGSLSEGIAAVESLYSSSLRNVVERLTSRTIGSDPYFGETLLNLGNTEGAIAAYDRALEILQSDAYLIDNTSTTSRSTGVRGCLKFVDFYTRVNQIEKQAAAAQVCSDIQNSYFGEANDDELDVAEAYIDVVDAFTFVGNMSKVNETAASLTSFLNTRYTRDDVYERKAQVGVIYLENQNTNAGIASFVELANQLGDTEFSDSAEKAETLINVLDAIGSLGYEDNSLFDRASASIIHKKYFANDNFASETQQLKALIASLSDELTTSLMALPISELSELYDEAVNTLADNRQYDKVRTLISNLGFSGEEQILSFSLLANSLALQDDFPFTDVASVDSDGDGLANFFAVNASQESIDDSGITADTDADNDSILDEDDLLPLSPSND